MLRKPHSSVAQLAEHSTVNRRVTGSSPVRGAQSLSGYEENRLARRFSALQGPFALGLRVAARLGPSMRTGGGHLRGRRYRGRYSSRYLAVFGRAGSEACVSAFREPEARWGAATQQPMHAADRCDTPPVELSRDRLPRDPPGPASEPPLVWEHADRFDEQCTRRAQPATGGAARIPYWPDRVDSRHRVERACAARPR
jgi:hypothetical protein